MCSSLITAETTVSVPVRILRFLLETSTLSDSETSPWKIFLRTGEDPRDISSKTRRVRAEEKEVRIMNKREEKSTYSKFDSLGKNIAAPFIFAVWTGRCAIAPDRSVGEDRPAGVVGVEDRVLV